MISKQTFEEGDAVSIAAQASPGESVIRAEYARGRFGGKDGQAFHIDANSSFGQSNISAQFENASASFLGSIQNTEGAFNLVHVRCVALAQTAGTGPHAEAILRSRWRIEGRRRRPPLAEAGWCLLPQKNTHGLQWLFLCCRRSTTIPFQI